MKNYVTTAVIWLKNMPVEIGTTVSLTEKQARYIQHALEEIKPEAVAAPVEEVADEAPRKAGRTKADANGAAA